MTWPAEYQRASIDFQRFMVEAREAANLSTTNQAWTMVEGVFLAFRKRLTARQVFAFANILPPLVKALFLNNWQPDQSTESFATRDAMTSEVQALRKEHNFAPSNSIEAVALALRSVVDSGKLERILSSFSPEARGYPKTITATGFRLFSSNPIQATFDLVENPFGLQVSEPQAVLIVSL